MELKAVMYAKLFYNYLQGICQRLEEEKLWQASGQSKMSISEILRYDVAKFMLYVSSGDGRLSDEHMMMYQIVTGYTGAQEQLHEWLCQHQIYTKDFSVTVPMTFKIISESEQYATARGICFDTQEPISDLFASFFRMIGNILFCDHRPQSTPYDITAYRKTHNGFEKEPYDTMKEFYTLIDRLTNQETV